MRFLADARERQRPPRSRVAEGVGFEPTEAQKTSTVFETVPFVRSGSLPPGRLSALTGHVYDEIRRDRGARYAQVVSSAGATRLTR